MPDTGLGRLRPQEQTVMDSLGYAVRLVRDTSL